MALLSLGDALPAEIKRVNEEIIPAYVEIIPLAPMTALTVAVMRADVRRAVEALASGDVVAMIREYENLREFHL